MFFCECTPILLFGFKIESDEKIKNFSEKILNYINEFDLKNKSETCIINDSFDDIDSDTVIIETDLITQVIDIILKNKFEESSNFLQFHYISNDEHYKREEEIYIAYNVHIPIDNNSIIITNKMMKYLMYIKDIFNLEEEPCFHLTIY